MAITINGSSNTITGLAAGGLPDNTIDNGSMADDAIGVAELSATGTASASTFLRGDNSWAEAGGGKILQVKHSMEFSHRTTTSNTFVDTGFPEFTITPTVATSKILVFARSTNSNSGGHRGGIITIYRKVGSGGTYADMRTDGNNGGLTHAQSVEVNDIIGWTICIEDDHNTTDTVYYKIYFRSNNSDSTTGIGRAAGGSNGTNSLTALEFEP